MRLHTLQDVAPRYAAILMGISNTVGTVPGILSPALTGALIVDRSPAEWRTVFIITAGVYAGGALLYGLLASGERQVPSQRQLWLYTGLYRPGRRTRRRCCSPRRRRRRTTARWRRRRRKLPGTELL